MCMSSCGMLYKEGKSLKEITCPCGLGYWDIFGERFVSGDQIREGKPSRREYEAKVRENFEEHEFEARLREQWIKHFFSCPTKLALDEKANREGRGDTSSRWKAEAELREIARGDFRSRGRSHSMYEGPRRPGQGDEREWRQRATSQVTSRERGSWEVASLPDDTILPAATGGYVRHAAGSDSYPLSDRKRLAETVTSGYKKGAGTAAVRSQGSNTASDRFFLPSDGIRPDVLEHHRQKNMFGTGATVQPYTNSNGRPGYLIRATIKPSTELISQLMKDSMRVEEAMRQKTEIDQRASVDIGRRVESARTVPDSAPRDSQTTKYSVNDIVKETQDLKINSDRTGRSNDRGQYDRSHRSVIESPSPIIERYGRHEPHDLSPVRETTQRTPGDVSVPSTSNRQDVDGARRRDLGYRSGSGDVIIARRESRPEPREPRYQQRDGLFEPGDIRTPADTRRQTTAERPRDGQNNRQDRRASRRDTPRNPRNTDDDKVEDLPQQRRHDASRRER